MLYCYVLSFYFVFVCAYIAQFQDKLGVNKMFKRSIARLLIFLQFYSCVFQGVAHGATLVEEHDYHHGIGCHSDLRIDESEYPKTPDVHISTFTHLYSAVNDLGELSLALSDGLKPLQFFTIPVVKLPEDQFEYGGVTVNSSRTHFSFQGLKVSINKVGVMVVEGRQDSQRSLFLGSNRPIVLSNVEAHALTVAGPQILSAGSSRIETLRLEGHSVDDNEASFINAGQLTSRELFLKNLRSQNTVGITSKHFSIHGEFTSSGTLNSEELIVEEASFLKLLENNRFEVKELLLSKASHWENHATTLTVNVEVLNSLDGHLVNYGSLKIGEVAHDSTFASLLNRRVISIGKGEVKTQRFNNIGTWISEQSQLLADEGSNSGQMKLLALKVKKQWTNHPSSTLLLSILFGEGELDNEGTVQSSSLQIHLRKFINGGEVHARELLFSFSLLPITNRDSGVIEVDRLIAKRKVLNDGRLIVHKATTLENGLLVGLSGDATLSSLTLLAGEVANEGELFLQGIEYLRHLTFINRGKLTIDAKLGGLHDNSLYPYHSTASTDPEFSHFLNATKIKINGTRYKNLVEATTDVSPIDPVFKSLNLNAARSKGFQYKQQFLSLARKTTLRDLEESVQQIQAQIIEASEDLTLLREQERLERFIAEYKARFSEISQLTLAGNNHLRGTLHLKRGWFNLGQLTNQGMLTQEQSAINGLSPQGQWRAIGSLRLEGYTGYTLPLLEVEGELIVKVPSMDGFKALDPLISVKAHKVTMHAYSLRSTSTTLERLKKQYPWPLVLITEYGIDNAIDIEAPELTLHALSLKTTGNLLTSGHLEIRLREEAQIAALLAGREGVFIEAKTVGILGKQDISSAVAPHILFKRNGIGIYAQGPVVLKGKTLIENQFGIIQGSSYQIAAPKFINTTGLLTAVDPTSPCLIDVPIIINTREVQGSYTIWRGCRGFNARCGWTTARGGGRNNPGNWVNTPNCNCAGSVDTYESSGEGIIFAQGDLRLNYTTLEMVVSRITSGGALTLQSEDKSITYQDDPDIQVLPGTTVMTKRNGHTNHVVAKKDLTAELEDADMATSLQGQNIFVKAVKLTLQSLGMTKDSPGQTVNLLSVMQESQSSGLFKVVRGNDGKQYHDLCLPFSSRSFPSSLVILGKDPSSQLGNSLEQAMTMRALHQAMGSSLFTLYRGIDGLGFDMNHFFEATAAFVRGHRDTVSSKKMVRWGDEEREMEALINPTLTEKDLQESGVVGIFQQFAEQIHRLESEQKALDDLIQAKQTTEMMFVFPKETQKRPGVLSPGDVTLISQKDLGVFTNVKGKNVALVSTQGSTTVGSETVRHHQAENYHDVLVRTRTEADERLLLQGQIDVVMKAIETHSGLQTDIIAETGMILDQAVATVDYMVTHHHSKKASTTTAVTHIHQNVSSHTSGCIGHPGVVNIRAHTGILQQGVHLEDARLYAPMIIQEDVHDQRMVESHTVTHQRKRGFGKWFGIKERKVHHFSESTSTSIGCESSGESFIATAQERFQATNPLFRATRTDITADEIELKVGQSTHQSHAQSTYRGVVWNKQKVAHESHATHQNPTFEHNVYLHAPKVVLERVKGSQETFDKVMSDVPIQVVDVEDQHHSTTKTQKSLSTGASLILSLAVSLATGNPFSASSLSAAMIDAGYGTLCSQAATCLVEQDGDPTRAVKALSERDIGRKMFMSVTTAGLTKGIGDPLGITSSTAFENLAKQHLLQSAVNTVLAVSIDGQDPNQALLQGATSAALNTLAAYGAGKIGDAYASDDPLSYLSHKLLHGGLGALGGGLSGGIASTLCGGTFEEGITRVALSGGFGSMVGETAAEFFDSKHLGDLVATSLAFGLGMDPVIAYQASHIATEYNFSRHRLNPIEGLVKAVEEGMEPQEGEPITPEQEAYLQEREAFVEEALEKATQLHGALSDGDIEHVIQTASRLYAVKYAADRSAAMAGQAVITASELAPGMHGINKAWMGAVQHMRGELPEGALASEVLGGLHSSLTDVALGMATMGAYQYYRGVKVVGGAVKTSQKYVRVTEGSINLTESGRMYGTHGDLVRSKAQDSHHIIQHAAVKNIPGYNRELAPAIQLRGPATRSGTEHNLATLEQRRPGGGVYDLERIRAYRAMRKGGLSKEEAKQQIRYADDYFQSLGVTSKTTTRIPGNRKGTVE